MLMTMELIATVARTFGFKKRSRLGACHGALSTRRCGRKGLNFWLCDGRNGALIKYMYCYEHTEGNQEKHGPNKSRKRLEGARKRKIMGKKSVPLFLKK
mmetsp:Transcript_17620/g.37124  ORF Transcript_17620/g.37124 Transcript_17620/m.37124 type:complete len:99 (+) Transcript_17620:944-1240(+)